MNYRNKIWAAVFFILAASIFFYPILGGERVYFARDFQLLFYPMKFHLAKSFADGEIPFWLSASFSGAPFLADMQSGVFYPPSVIFLIFPFPLSLNLYIVFHFVCGGFFFYLLARSRSNGFFPAILGGAAFIFGGYLVSTINVLNNLQAAVWVPAVLWSATRFFETGKTGYWAALVISIALVTLGGEPQTLVMAVVLLFLYTAICLKQFSLKSFAILVGTLALSQLVCAVQWIPTIEAFNHSVRAGGLSGDMAAIHSLKPSDLKGLVVAHPFGNPFDIDLLSNFSGKTVPYILSIFSGRLILLVSLLAFFKPSRDTFFWWGMAVFSITLSLGYATPFFGIAHKIFPFFRFPEKYFFVAAISFPLLAAAGANRLSGLIRKKGLSVINPVVMVVLILMAGIELFAANLTVNPTISSKFYSAPANSQSSFDKPLRVASHFLEESSGSVLAKQKKWRLMHKPLSGISYGDSYALGQGGLELKIQSVMTELAEKLPVVELIKFYRLLGVEVVYTDDPRLTGSEHFLLSMKKVSEGTYRLKNSAKKFHFAWKVIPAGEKNSLDIIAESSFDVVNDAVIDGWGKGTLPNISQHKISGAPLEKVNGITVNTSGKGDGFMVFADSYYPGWRAYVDGKETEIYRTNFFFKGIFLEDGEHKVEFSYIPTNFYLGAGISILALLGLASSCVIRSFTAS